MEQEQRLELLVRKGWVDNLRFNGLKFLFYDDDVLARYKVNLNNRKYQTRVFVKILPQVTIILINIVIIFQSVNLNPNLLILQNSPLETIVDFGYSS